MKNKNLLFTLILIASCFGILGIAEKGEAANCNDLYCLTIDNCHKGDVACEDQKSTTYVYRCLAGTAAKYKIGCDADSKCVVGSPTLVEGCTDYCCRLLKGENCKCDEKEKCIFTGPCEEECVDISKCTGGANVVISSDGPTDCPGGLVCVDRGSCKKETTGCNCQYGGWLDSDTCGTGGCLSTQKPQIRTENPTVACGTGDCGNISRCHNDDSCGGTTPTACYWQNVGCGPTGGCKNTEMYQKCVPSECSGGLCNAGENRCDSGHGCSGGAGDVGNNGVERKEPGGAVRFTNPLSTDSFEALIMGIINWILGIVVSLAILFLIIGGLMYITSAGDEERIKKAKNIILYAIVGLGVVILSWSIITELKDILGVK